MKLIYNANYSQHPRNIMRRCGYQEQVNRDGVVNYVRRIARQPYPRFHIYIDELEQGFRVKLHLDQKKPSYGENTAHSGEYDGEQVRQEAGRITQIIRSFAR